MISVVLPSYNHSDFLEKRIESILNQTFQDFELIILDDKSPDNSQEIIEKYRGDERISHIIYNEQNSGSTFHQWNKGISLAKGDYIWITESDDYADPTLLQTLYDNIKKEKNIVISYCESYKVDENDVIVGDWSESTDLLDKEWFSKDFIIDGKEFIHKYLIHLNAVANASAVLFRKDAFLKIGGANTNIGFAGDWLAWLKMAEQGKIAFTCQKLNHNRRHSKSVVTKAIANNTSKKDLFIKKYDLNMRIEYQNYLDAIHNDPTTILLNKERIVDDAIIEIRYLWTQKQYKMSLKYLFIAYRYSIKKSKLLKRIFNFIR